MWKTMATFLLCCLGSARAEKPAEKRAQKTEGMRLLETYQCPRCHEGTGLPAVRQEKHCVSCHQSILKGTFPIDSATLKTWQSHLHSLNAAPSFVGIGKRLRRDFVKDFLLRPYDVRSGLPAMMPRLGISETQAAAIAQALIPHEQLDLPKGDAEAGRKLVAMLGCAACHNMGGFPGMESAQKPAALRAAYDAQTVLPLAPDLRFVRDRFQPGMLARFLLSPKDIKPDTPMPAFGLNPTQATDISTFLWTAPLSLVSKTPIPKRLPILERKVGFDEVNERVFRRTCWHCHSTPAYANGDGGPGNTGGFGFKGRGFSVTTYADIASGRLNDQGERESVFAKLPDGTPLLLNALLLRQKEVWGEIDPKHRGMPLGLPPLTPEQIQLVESWIAQGRPE